MPTDLAGGQGLSWGFSFTEPTLSSRLGESSGPRHSDRGQKQGVLHTGNSKGIPYNLYFETFMEPLFTVFILDLQTHYMYSLHNALNLYTFWYNDKLTKLLVYRHEYWMFILASAKKCHRNKKCWSFGQSVIERSGIIQVCQRLYTYTCSHLFTCSSTWIFHSSNHASIMLINLCTFYTGK